MYKVDKSKLFIKALIYRVLIIGIQTVVTYFFIKDITQSFKISLIWNIINIVLYYIYDYLYLTYLGVRGKKKENN
jgi:uncharacterized membrane protein